MSGQWVYGAIAVLTLLHAIALLYAYRNGTAVEDAADRETEQYVSDDVVECPSCGEHNDVGYQYCRRCVSELPGQITFIEGASTPGSRRTL